MIKYNTSNKKAMDQLDVLLNSLSGLSTLTRIVTSITFTASPTKPQTDVLPSSYFLVSQVRNYVRAFSEAKWKSGQMRKSEKIGARSEHFR